MHTLIVIGRILLGGFFIYNAFGHFMGLQSLAGYAKSKHVPAPKFSVGLTGLMLLIGGLAVLLDVHFHIGLAILVVFMVVTTLMMHPFWKEKDVAHRMNDQISFAKNVAIIGALLMLFAK